MRYLDVAAGRVEGVLHVHCDGAAAEGVQAEHGVVTLHGQAWFTANLRDQVPVHVVAEGFVEARASSDKTASPSAMPEIGDASKPR